ncbi:hypothetical protein V7x_24140 [Crateriforma conspicua]|uniref:Uncharacterized protein n=1 Tax=Crateriforma conspicua TaxID=2527996 RepID=A0A5C6G0S2_9PLAN|nr:hypothetical protein V7x_24140 [Crateriforma conspicua]
MAGESEAGNETWSIVPPWLSKTGDTGVGHRSIGINQWKVASVAQTEVDFSEATERSVCPASLSLERCKLASVCSNDLVKAARLRS